MTITNIYIKNTQLRLSKWSRCKEGETIFKLGQKQVAETSFVTFEEMDQPFDLPPWIAREVSNDSRFTCGALASLSPDQAAELLRQSTGAG